MATAAAVAATFRSLLQPAANGVPVPVPTVRFQSLQRYRVGLHLFGPLPGRPFLLAPSAAAGEAFSSDSEDYSEQDEEYFEEEEEEDEAEEAEAPPAYSSSQSRPPGGQEPGRLFVGNLPYTMTAEELSEAFSEAGRVDDAQVPALNPTKIENPSCSFASLGQLLKVIPFLQIIYDKITNRSRGFAFVTMATAEEAAKGIQMFDGAVSSASVVPILPQPTKSDSCLCL